MTCDERGNCILEVGDIVRKINSPNERYLVTKVDINGNCRLEALNIVHVPIEISGRAVNFFYQFEA